MRALHSIFMAFDTQRDSIHNFQPQFRNFLRQNVMSIQEPGASAHLAAALVPGPDGPAPFLQRFSFCNPFFSFFVHFDFINPKSVTFK
jgi:hypothetical protein